MKKFIFLQILLSFLFLANPLMAANEELVVQDFQKKTGIEDDDLAVLAVGKAYIDDVKKYHEKFSGDNIEEDLSEEILKDNPNFSRQQVESWQTYIKNGVRAYRWYLNIKNKVMEFLLTEDVVVQYDDDEYEMGENEEYIPTDNPLVIKDFKKVVAYSNLEKDERAAAEKRAKELSLPLPSQSIAKIKKAILQKDWKSLFDFGINEELKKINENLKKQSDLNDENLRAVLLPEKDGVDDEEKVKWVVILEANQGSFVLYDDYDSYEGIKVDVEKCKNLKDITFGFNMPTEIKVSENDAFVGWHYQVPIYFEGTVVDKNKDVSLNVRVTADVCVDDGCKRITVNPKTELKYNKFALKTSYATYVETLSTNIPNDVNAKYFNFGKAVWENNDNQKNIRLEIKTDKPELITIFPVGENREKMSNAQLSLLDGVAIVRFKWLDDNFSPIGKTVVFWVRGDNNKQYFHAAKIEELSLLDLHSGKFSLGVLGLAFLGGLLLNLMPCVFPVLFLKLLAFTKFGGLNLKQIRKNFIFNSCGIIISFAIMAFVLAGLKISGRAIGWGVQFQNIYFMSLIIWVVFVFFAMVCGLLKIDGNKLTDKVLKGKKGAVFEFLSGMFLVLLSTPCIAPYLGTAFGIALTESVEIIILTVMVVGVGLACPYIMIAMLPQIAFAMPKPGKWMGKIDLLMKLLLFVTLWWLISVLVAQTSEEQLWHWIGYLAIAFVVLFVADVAKNEIDKQSNREVVKIEKRIVSVVLSAVLLGLVLVSITDARNDYIKHLKMVEQTKVKAIDFNEIKRHLSLGEKVLVKVGADWCLTCKYNNALVFDTEYIESVMEKQKVKLIDVDWTSYQKDVLDFMQKFGRTGLPFYIFFSPKYEQGIVLDEMIKDYELKNILEL